MQFSFSGELIEWRGPAPFYFVAIPSSISAEIREDAKLLSYGWGVIPVRGLIGVTEFTTSLIPRDGVLLLPVKNAVRLPERLQLGELISAEIELGAR